MIRLGLVGVADPRHRWFLAAAQRRRAGVRLVGLSEPDPAARRAFADQYGIETWADHRDLLARASPSLVAIARPDAGPVVLDALYAGSDVLVAPPICDSLAELDSLAESATTYDRRVTAALTYRGHPAARTAAELIPRLGRVQLVSLLLRGEWTADRLRRSMLEGLDVFRLLTAAPAIRTTAIGNGHPVRDGDSAELRAAYGELVLLATATGAAESSADEPVFEVRLSSDHAGEAGLDHAGEAEVIQVCGEAGAFEWDVRTGVMRSAFDGRSPIMVSCGRPDPPEWVLNHLLRRARPAISTEQTLDLARTLLTLESTGGLDLAALARSSLPRPGDR